MKRPNFIYAISDGTAIKIGISNNPHKRLKSLSTGNKNKLTLLGYFEGTFVEEKEIHNNFIKIRDNGEWMVASESLINFLNEKLPNNFITINDGILKSHPKIPL